MQALVEALFSSHPAVMLLVDPSDGRIVGANAAAERFYGWSADELRARRISELNTMSVEEITAAMQGAAAGSLSDFHFRHRLADGSERYVQVLSGPVAFEERAVLHSIIIDETPRVRAELALARRNRLFSMLSETNQRLVRDTTRARLLQEICEVAVRRGGFVYAWVGLSREDGGVDVAAHAGPDDGFVENLRVTLNPGDSRAQGPTGRAIREGRPVIVQDITEDPAMAVWLESALNAGVRSGGSFPIREAGRVVGAITLYAGDPDFFDVPECATLAEMATDVSFGLGVIAAAEQRDVAEKETRRLTTELSAYLRGSPAISYALRRAEHGWQTVWVTENAIEQLGYTMEQLLSGDWWSRAVHPDDAARASAEFAELEAKGECRHEYRILTVAGQERWVLDTARLVKDPHTNEVSVSGTWVDITEQHAAQERLAVSERFQHLLLEHIGSAVIAADMDGHLTLFNRVAREWHGLDANASLEPSEWTSRYSLFEPDGKTPLPPDRIPLVRAMRGDTVRDQEMVLAPEGLPARAVVVNGSALFDDQGRQIGAIAIMHDRTRERDVEQALRLRVKALESAADAMVLTDREGRVEWANPAFTMLTGYTVGEVAGRNPREFARSGLTPREIYTDLWDTVLRGEVWRGELINRRKDGTTYPEWLSITPVRSDSGEVEHFIAIKRDLTEDRALRANLLQAQKMESVGRLAGGVAHDFNNLLTVINGSVELAVRHLGPNAAAQDDLDEIRRAAQRAAALTRQLLAFSRRQILRREVADVNERLSDLVKMLGRLIGEDVTLEVVTQAARSNVLIDVGQLEQAIVNLVVNARDAMPRGGTLRIATRNVQLDAAAAERITDVAPGDYLEIAVSDTGTGIDESTLSHLFEPFFTTKPQGKGTGLGLSTVYGIVRQSGGVVTVESVLAKGTTFRVLLPTTDAAVERVSAAPSARVVQRRGSILIVDDESILRKVAQRILANEGYVAIEAGTGEEALEIVRSRGGAVDIVLTDVVMPGMTGSELAAKLQSEFPQVKIIFSSGYTEDMIVRHGVDEATVDYLPKPYTVDALTRKIAERLAGVGDPVSAPRPRHSNPQGISTS